MGMAIAGQTLAGVNELVVVAFKAGAEELTAAAALAPSFNYTISTELAVEICMHIPTS